MKISEFLQFGHSESKRENENTPTSEVFLELQSLFSGILNNFDYI
jgi:hypothetical protein